MHPFCPFGKKLFLDVKFSIPKFEIETDYTPTLPPPISEILDPPLLLVANFNLF